MRPSDIFWWNVEPTLIAELGSRKKLVKMPVGYLNESTGPKAKFILILCATSGMVEKAINPERTEIRQSCKNEKYLCNVSLTEVGLCFVICIFLLQWFGGWIGKLFWVILQRLSAFSPLSSQVSIFLLFWTSLLGWGKWGISCWSNYC